MNNLHIVDSYKIWTVYRMRGKIYGCCFMTYQSYEVEKILNRPFWTLYVEWWLHNIGYYVTKPFKSLESCTLRFKDVDLNSW